MEHTARLAWIRRALDLTYKIRNNLEIQAWIPFWGNSFETCCQVSRPTMVAFGALLVSGVSVVKQYHQNIASCLPASRAGVNPKPSGA